MKRFVCSTQLPFGTKIRLKIAPSEKSHRKHRMHPNSTPKNPQFFSINFQISRNFHGIFTEFSPKIPEKAIFTAIPPSNSSNISHPLQFQKGNSFVSKGSVTFSNCNTVSTEGGVRVECVERVVSVLRKNILHL